MRDFRFQPQARSIEFDPVKAPDVTQKILNEKNRQIAFMRRNASFQKEHTSNYINALNKKLQEELKGKKKKWKWKQDLEDAYFKQEQANFKQEFENEYGEKLQDSKQTKQLLDFAKVGVKAAVAVDGIRRKKAKAYVDSKIFQHVTAETLSEAYKIKASESISLQAALQKAIFNEAVRTGMSEKDAKKQINIDGYRANLTHNYSLALWAKNIKQQVISAPEDGQENWVFGSEKNGNRLRLGTNVSDPNNLTGGMIPAIPTKIADVLSTSNDTDQIDFIINEIQKSHLEPFSEQNLNMTTVSLQAKEKFNEYFDVLKAQYYAPALDRQERRESETNSQVLMGILYGQQTPFDGSHFLNVVNYFGNGDKEKGWAKAEEILFKATGTGQFDQEMYDRLEGITMVDPETGNVYKVRDRVKMMNKLQNGINHRKELERLQQEGKNKQLTQALQREWDNKKLVHGIDLGTSDAEEMIDKCKKLGIDPWDGLINWGTANDNDPSAINEHLESLERKGLLFTEDVINAKISGDAKKKFLKLTIDGGQVGADKRNKKLDLVYAKISEAVDNKAYDKNVSSLVVQTVQSDVTEQIASEAKELFLKKVFPTYREAFDHVAMEWVKNPDFGEQYATSKTSRTDGKIVSSDDYLTRAYQNISNPLTRAQQIAKDGNVPEYITTAANDTFVVNKKINELAPPGFNIAEVYRPNNTVKMLAHAARSKTNWRGTDLDFLNEWRTVNGLPSATPGGEILSSIGLYQSKSVVTSLNQELSHRAKILQNAKDEGVSESELINLKNRLAVTTVVKEEMAEKYNISIDGFYNVAFNIQGRDVTTFSEVYKKPLKELSLTNVMDMQQRGDIDGVTGLNITRNDIQKYVEDRNLDPTKIKLTPKVVDDIFQNTLVGTTETMAKTGDSRQLFNALDKRPLLADALFNIKKELLQTGVGSIDPDEELEFIRKIFNVHGIPVGDGKQAVPLYDLSKFTDQTMYKLLGDVLRQSRENVEFLSETSGAGRQDMLTTEDLRTPQPPQPPQQPKTNYSKSANPITPFDGQSGFVIPDDEDGGP